MDKELILRTLINIIDVKNQQEWKIFDSKDLINVLKDYMQKMVVCDQQAAYKDIENYLSKYRSIFKKIVDNKNITVNELSEIREPLIDIKRKYFIEKN